MASLWDKYSVTNAYDEMRSFVNQARAASHRLSSYLESLNRNALGQRKIATDLAIMEIGSLIFRVAGMDWSL